MNKITKLTFAALILTSCGHEESQHISTDRMEDESQTEQVQLEELLKNLKKENRYETQINVMGHTGACSGGRSL